jgi:hypothetical protein
LNQTTSKIRPAAPETKNTRETARDMGWGMVDDHPPPFKQIAKKGGPEPVVQAQSWRLDLT